MSAIGLPVMYQLIKNKSRDISFWIIMYTQCSFKMRFRWVWACLKLLLRLPISNIYICHFIDIASIDVHTFCKWIRRQESLKSISYPALVDRAHLATWEKNISIVNYVTSHLTHLSTASDTLSKAMFRGLCQIVALQSIHVKGNMVMLEEVSDLIFIVRCAKVL